MIKLHEALRSWHSLTQLHHYNIVETGWEKNRRQRNFSWWAAGHFNVMMWSNTSHLTQATTDLSSALRESVFQVLSCRDSEGVIGCRTLRLDKCRPQVLMTNSCFVTEATLTACCNYEKTREIMQVLLRLYLAENMEQSGGARLGEPTSNTPCPGPVIF